MKVGRKPEYPGKTPGDEVQKMKHTTARRFKPRTRAVALVAGSESRHANRYTTHRPQHWWQASKADVLNVTPRIAPSIGGRLGKQTC